MLPPEKLFRSLLKKGRGTERFNCRFQLQKRRQLFIRMHNKASSVLALCGGNPKLSVRVIGT